MFRLLAAGALTACYSPAAPQGVPCPDQVCPLDQRCVANVCIVGSTVDAGPGDGAGLMTLVAPLTGTRWIMPCLFPDPTDSAFCLTPSRLTQVVNLTGAASDRMSVTVRIRGVSEVAPYAAGTPGAGTPWYVGGAVTDNFHNTYQIVVSSPPGIYQVNYAASPPDTVVALDYMASFPVDGNAVVMFVADPQDPADPASSQLVNKDAAGQAITIPGVVTTPSPFDGQFIRLDVVGVTAR